MEDVNTSTIAKEILQKAVKLRDPLRRCYIALATFNRPARSTEIGNKAGYARAYTNMRLLQLQDMGLVKSHKEWQIRYFEVVKE